MVERRAVAVLGASGLVGQRFQQRLASHPMFELVAVIGSENTADSLLSEVEWRLDEPRPNLPQLRVLNGADLTIESQLQKLNCQLVFSAVPNTPARDLERRLAAAGIHVFSNASSHRRIPGIPLVIADLNPEHLTHFGNLEENGSICCSTNCTVVPIAHPLKPISEEYGISSVEIHTRQALSGGGWRLLNDRKALAGEVNPAIPGEEEKVNAELLHLLGRLNGPVILPADFSAKVTCNRVESRDGHLVYVDVHLNRAAELADVVELLQGWRSTPQKMKLPSAPSQPILVVPGSPSRAEHLWSGSDSGPTSGERVDPSTDLRAGMGTTVGAMQLITPSHLRFEALSHNTIRGAAGGCVLLAELALAEGYLG